LPTGILIEPRGGESVEAGIQAEREKTALIASYMSHSHIPESASDLQPRLGEPLASDTPTVPMLPGADIAEIIASNDAAAQAPSSLSDLLAQIATPSQPKAMTETWSQQLQQPSLVQQSILQSLGLKSPADIAALLSSVSPDALSMLQQQQQQPLVQPSYGGDNGFGASQPAYTSDEQQQGYWNDSGPSGSSVQWNGSRDDWDEGGYRGRGRGGRGRGRGRGRDYGSKKLCNFWAKG
jgi:protein phosphatase 1 regulatory subunit 10